jgi:hypothetical protein
MHSRQRKLIFPICKAQSAHPMIPAPRITYPGLLTQDYLHTMLDPNSRYYPLPTAEYTTIDGRKIIYKRRRFLPQGHQLPLQTEVTATRDDRLDVLTARTLGEAEQFWQVCDANNVMNPDDLLTETVQVIRIPIPQPTS